MQDSRACSEHFSTEVFDNKYGLLGEKAVLKSNAVPRIFENPELHSEQATPTIFEVHSQVSIFHPKTTDISTYISLKCLHYFAFLHVFIQKIIELSSQ